MSGNEQTFDRMASCSAIITSRITEATGCRWRHRCLMRRIRRPRAGDPALAARNVNVNRDVSAQDSRVRSQEGDFDVTA